MLEKAESIRKLIKGKIKTYVDCDSPMAFLNTLESNGAKYVFVVNDKRTFGDYVGKKYKAIMEEGLPQTVTVELKEDNCKVYDLVSHRELETRNKNGSTFVNLNLKPAWGAFLAVYPQKISKINIKTPEKFISGKESIFTVEVEGENAKPVYGVQPLKVTFSDPNGKRNEYSGYYAAKNGTCKIKFIPAQNDVCGKWNVEVEELSSSMKEKKSFDIKAQ
jgi:hypothetical protein